MNVIMDRDKLGPLGNVNFIVHHFASIVCMRRQRSSATMSEFRELGRPTNCHVPFGILHSPRTNDTLKIIDKQ